MMCSPGGFGCQLEDSATEMHPTKLNTFQLSEVLIGGRFSWEVVIEQVL